jgi:hypothetical protein
VLLRWTTAILLVSSLAFGAGAPEGNETREPARGLAVCRRYLRARAVPESIVMQVFKRLPGAAQCWLASKNNALAHARTVQLCAEVNTLLPPGVLDVMVNSYYQINPGQYRLEWLPEEFLASAGSRSIAGPDKPTVLRTLPKAGGMRVPAIFFRSFEEREVFMQNWGRQLGRVLRALSEILALQEQLNASPEERGSTHLRIAIVMAYTFDAKNFVTGKPLDAWGQMFDHRSGFTMEAVSHFKRALALMQPIRGEDSPEIGVVRHLLGKHASQGAHRFANPGCYTNDGCKVLPDSEAYELFKLAQEMLETNLRLYASNYQGQGFSREAELFFHSFFEWLVLMKRKLEINDSQFTKHQIAALYRSFVLTVLRRVSDDWYAAQAVDHTSFLLRILDESSHFTSAERGSERSEDPLRALELKAHSLSRSALIELLLSAGWEEISSVFTPPP